MFFADADHRVGNKHPTVAPVVIALEKYYTLPAHLSIDFRGGLQFRLPPSGCEPAFPPITQRESAGRNVERQNDSAAISPRRYARVRYLNFLRFSAITARSI